MAKIVRFYEQGGPEVLKLEDVEPGAPGAGEVRLKVDAIGLNRAEIMFRSGMYLEEPVFPSRIGYEAAGVVDAVGPDVQGVNVGDVVSTIPSFSIGKYGVYGESAMVPAHAVAAYPRTLSPEQGAAIWMQYVTAYGALKHIVPVGKGDWVLVTAPSSSTGRAAIEIAKAEGAGVIAATTSPGKREALLTAGADAVIVTTEEDLVAGVQAVTGGKGAKLTFDAVGGPLMEALAAAAAPLGTIVEYGFLAAAPTPYPAFPAVSKGLTVRGYTLFEVVREPGLLAACKQYIYDGLAEGRLIPAIDRVFTLDDIVQAHRYMESGVQNGKIVVRTT